MYPSSRSSSSSIIVGTATTNVLMANRVTVEVTSGAGERLEGSSGFGLARNRQQATRGGLTHPQRQRPRQQRQRLHDPHQQQQQRLSTLASSTAAAAAASAALSSSPSLATERLITFGKIRRFRETSAASPSSRTSPSAPYKARPRVVPYLSQPDEDEDESPKKVCLKIIISLLLLLLAFGTRQSLPKPNHHPHTVAQLAVWKTTAAMAKKQTRPRPRERVGLS
uniref:Uncharacterized protein n=1 Tax=Anopheles atroparvus TaxID=41427 RepID=A0A182J3F4_ANOAO